MNQELKEYRQMVEDNFNNANEGRSNCIEFCFPKLRGYYPGHDRGMLLGITGSAKSGKTALVSHLVFYSTMDYLWEHPEAFKCHFLWFALEESYKKFYARLDSYLLNKYYNVRVNFNTLLSKTADMRMSDEVYTIWSSPEYQKLVGFYTGQLSLVKYKKTTSAILKRIHKYAKELGTVVSDSAIYNEFDSSRIKEYIPKYPDGYFFVVIDNLTNITPTKEEGITYRAIEKLCKELVQLKDIYNFCFVVLVQQNIKETGNLRAFMNENILSSSAGIRDYPSLEADCTDLWALSNPCIFQQLKEYPASGGYDLDAFKRNYFRVLQFIDSRNGEPSPPIPLFFDGAISSFEMLPPPDSKEIYKVYQKIQTLNN